MTTEANTVLSDEQIAREFTYYPIMSEGNCWFRIETIKGSETYHQCDDYARIPVASYWFCERHAKVVNDAIGRMRHVV